MRSRLVLLDVPDPQKSAQLNLHRTLSELSSAAGRRLTLALPLEKTGSVERLLTTGADSAGIRCRLPRILTGVNAFERTLVYRP